ncbi:hypothetical protein BT69DRAFT_1281214 [Atractiella rhizophila]|nr:hypothetical protein BT69DRAFT_1281214 [Atractiella rhizophila]
MASSAVIYELVEDTDGVKKEMEEMLEKIGPSVVFGLNGQEVTEAKSILAADLATHPRIIFDREYLTSRLLLQIENVRLGARMHRDPTLQVQNGFDVVITRIQVSYYIQSAGGTTSDRIAVRDSAPHLGRGAAGSGSGVPIKCNRGDANASGTFEASFAQDGSDKPFTLPFAIRMNHKGDFAVSFQIQVRLTSSVPLAETETERTVAKDLFSRTIRIEEAAKDAYVTKGLMNAAWSTILEDVDTEWSDAGYVLSQDSNLPMLQKPRDSTPPKGPEASSSPSVNNVVQILHVCGISALHPPAAHRAVLS